ncbi:GNAT family N-acetyltransferase [Pelagibacterium sediminicola]|uniref:GNAT family N-acetyltransferase n=1 Tax=Pelagibacterium sediminicola TaxID=2248761 RepID=UPI000E322FD0|nr:GNAT family N-acetyltransferase [Pelagibacterium sediminicola]
MLDNLTLRTASIAEADKLGRLAFASWDSSMRQILRSETEAALQNERDALLLSFQLFCINATPAITVAERNGKPIGWAACEAMSAYISDLWVAPEFQRLGVGRMLLSRTEQGIFRAGYDVSVLETHAENGGAIRFYAREGYEIVWRGIKFSRMIGQRIEKVRMEKRLVVEAR